MPLPAPKKGERGDDFLQRCMGNPTMVADFPDNKQRYAVCQTQLRERKDMLEDEVTVELSDFEAQFKAFKDGKADAPKIHKSVSVKLCGDFELDKARKEVVLTVEQVDDDGETVLMSGGRIRNPEAGIPMIDSHNAFDSVVEYGLGAIRNPRFVEENGVKVLKGEPDFAPTPNGEIARILYMGVNGGKPYFTDVSMGFMVYDYDNATKTILEWEVFEVSLVTAGANRGAKFFDKKSIDKTETENIQIAKDLARFKQINEPFKLFSKLFLNEEFCKKLGYEKDGNLLVDIQKLYYLIDNKFTQAEAPIEEKEAPKKLVNQKSVVSGDTIRKAMLEIIEKAGK